MIIRFVISSINKDSKYRPFFLIPSRQHRRPSSDQEQRALSLFFLIIVKLLLSSNMFSDITRYQQAIPNSINPKDATQSQSDEIQSSWDYEWHEFHTAKVEVQLLLRSQLSVLACLRKTFLGSTSHITPLFLAFEEYFAHPLRGTINDEETPLLWSLTHIDY